jgi:hypothetical protein
VYQSRWHRCAARTMLADGLTAHGRPRGEAVRPPALHQSQGHLPLIAFVPFDKILNGLRHLAEMQIAARAEYPFGALFACAKAAPRAWQSGFWGRPLSGLFEKENSRLDGSDGALHLLSNQPLMNSRSQ